MSTNGGEISVRFTSQEEAKLWQAFTRIVVEGRKVALGLQDASESAVKFEKGLDKFAQQVKRVDAGPLGALREEMRKLDAAVKHDLLTVEQAAAGKIQAQKRYQEAVRKTAEQQARLGLTRSVDTEGMTTEQKIETGPLLDYNAAVEQLRASKDKLKLTDDELAAAEKAHHDEYLRRSAEIREEDARLESQRKKSAEAEASRKQEKQTERDNDAKRREIELNRQAADQIRRRDATPIERLAIAQEDLNDKLRRGVIEQEDFATLSKAAQDEYQRELKESADQAEKLKKREIELNRQAADQIRRQDASPIERLRMRQEELNDKIRRGAIEQQDFATLSKAAHDEYQRELRQSAADTDRLKREAVEASMRSGSSFQEMSAGALAAWATVGASVITVLREVRQASEQAGQALKAAAPSRGTLAQLALDDPEKYKQLTAQAEGLRARGVVKSLEEANQFVFAMESAGAGSEIDTFARAKRVGLMQDPSSMIASAAGIRESFGQAGGSFTDLINRSLVASASSPAKAEELLRGAGKAGVAARQQGINVDELLAATSILATAKGSADEGGSRLNALLSALSTAEPTRDRRGRVRRDSPLQESLRGRSLADIASDEKLGAMTPAQLQKALGSREAVEAFGVLREQSAKLRELTTQVGRGVDENKLGKGIATVEGDRRVMAAVRSEAAAGALEVSRLDRGQASLEVDAMVANAQRVIEKTPERGFLDRLQSLTTVGMARDMLQGRFLESATNFGGVGGLASGATRSAAGGLASSGFRVGLEAIGGDAFFLDVMRKIGVGGDKQAEAADKLTTAADKLTAAADRLNASSPAPRVATRTGPARLEAAGVN